MDTNNKIKIEEAKNLIPEEKSKIFFSEEGEIAIDCYETFSDLIILAAIGGVQAKDLDISIENNILIIKGYREDPGKEKNKKYFLKECHWGSFSRKIILPEGADIARAESFFQKGIIKIRIPIVQKVKEKKLEIKGN